MTKDELKDRISMALKDQILQQGFEIICKENAEAKERIKTLEYRCENIKDTDTMELVALQRENAELKKQLEMSNKDYNDNLCYSHHIEELLRMLVDSYNHKERFSFEKDLRKAEQFLKEE